MPQAMLPVLASFAFTAVSTIITSRAEASQTEKANAALKAASDLKKRQIAAINVEKVNEANRNFRVMAANRATDQVGRGLDPDGYYTGGNQQLKSSKIGADEYFQNIAGLGTQIIDAEDNANRIIGESSLGLAGQLGVAALGIGSDAAAAWKPKKGTS
tara:strand:+ start:522 stop:995 length:474 start_codon:yes stop_codon:yes gene_type:complete